MNIRISVMSILRSLLRLASGKRKNLAASASGLLIAIVLQLGSPDQSQFASAQMTDPATSMEQAEQIFKDSGSPSDRASLIVTIAFLRTTAYAEGVVGIPGVDPNRTQALSYRQIPLAYAFKDHPYWADRIIPCSGSLCSACTGAYQFHPDTFDAVRLKHGKKFWYPEGAFSPANQDLAAIYLMGDVGVWNALNKGALVEGRKVKVLRSSFANALAKGAGQWASFPRSEADASGHYGQGSPGVEKLWKFFEKQVAELSKT